MTRPEGRPGRSEPEPPPTHHAGLSPSSAAHSRAHGRAACPVWGLRFLTARRMKAPTGWGLGGCCKDGADVRANQNQLARAPPASRPAAVHALRVITGWDSKDSGQLTAPAPAGGWLAGAGGTGSWLSVPASHALRGSPATVRTPTPAPRHGYGSPHSRLPPPPPAPALLARGPAPRRHRPRPAQSPRRLPRRSQERAAQLGPHHNIPLVWNSFLRTHS